MALPEPEPGLVISYAYLWHHEHQSGHDEGRKDCPCVIVLAAERTSDGAAGIRFAQGAGDRPVRLRLFAAALFQRSARRIPVVAAEAQGPTDIAVMWPISEVL